MTKNEKSDSVKKNITLGAIFGYVAFFLNIISGLFFTPWLILSFGNSQYGIFTLATALINLFLIDFGLSNATTAFISKYKANNDKEKIEATLSIIYKTFFVIDLILLVIFIGLYFLSPYLYKGLTPDELSIFKKCLIIISLFSLISLPSTTLNGILSAYEKFAILKLADIIQRLLYISLATIVILLKLNIYILVAVQAISGLIVITFKYLFIKLSIKVKANFKDKVTKEFIRNILLYSLAASFVSICSRISFHFVPNILGAISTTDEVTYFGMASTIEGFVFSFGSVISTFFMAKIARIKKEENSAVKTTELSIKVGRFQFIILSLILLGLTIVGNDFLTIWMHGDSSYTPVYYGILLICTFQLFDAPQSVLKNAVYLERKTIKYHALFEGIGAILNVAFAFLLCILFKNIGLNASIGACLSILLSRTITFILKNITYTKLIGVDMKKYWTLVYLKGSIIFVTIFIILNRFKTLLPIENYVIRFLVMGFATVIMFISLTLLFNKPEKNIFAKIFKRS